MDREKSVNDKLNKILNLTKQYMLYPTFDIQHSILFSILVCSFLDGLQ